MNTPTQNNTFHFGAQGMSRMSQNPRSHLSMASALNQGRPPNSAAMAGTAAHTHPHTHHANVQRFNTGYLNHSHAMNVGAPQLQGLQRQQHHPGYLAPIYRPQAASPQVYGTPHAAQHGQATSRLQQAHQEVLQYRHQVQRLVADTQQLKATYHGLVVYATALRDRITSLEPLKQRYNNFLIEVGWSLANVFPLDPYQGPISQPQRPRMAPTMPQSVVNAAQMRQMPLTIRETMNELGSLRQQIEQLAGIRQQNLSESTKLQGTIQDFERRVRQLIPYEHWYEHWYDQVKAPLNAATTAFKHQSAVPYAEGAFQRAASDNQPTGVSASSTRQFQPSIAHPGFPRPTTASPTLRGTSVSIDLTNDDDEPTTGSLGPATPVDNGYTEPPRHPLLNTLAPPLALPLRRTASQESQPTMHPSYETEEDAGAPKSRVLPDPKVEKKKRERTYSWMKTNASPFEIEARGGALKKAALQNNQCISKVTGYTTYDTGYEIARVQAGIAAREAERGKNAAEKARKSAERTARKEEERAAQKEATRKAKEEKKASASLKKRKVSAAVEDAISTDNGLAARKKRRTEQQATFKANKRRIDAVHDAVRARDAARATTTPEPQQPASVYDEEDLFGDREDDPIFATRLPATPTYTQEEDAPGELDDELYNSQEASVPTNEDLQEDDDDNDALAKELQEMMEADDARVAAAEYGTVVQGLLDDIEDMREMEEEPEMLQLETVEEQEVEEPQIPAEEYDSDDPDNWSEEE